MEIGLGDLLGCRVWRRYGRVLILVLVEIGLGAEFKCNDVEAAYGLNPCFSGNRFGRQVPLGAFDRVAAPVLILVLVEIGLGGKNLCD